MAEVAEGGVGGLNCKDGTGGASTEVLAAEAVGTSAVLDIGLVVIVHALAGRGGGRVKGPSL